MSNISQILGNLLDFYQETVEDFPENIRLVNRILDLKSRMSASQLEAKAKVKVKVNSQIWEDLGVFKSDGVFRQLQRTHTYFGFLTQVDTLLNPVITENPYLDHIKTLVTPGDKNFPLVVSYLEHIREIQNDIIWFWKKKSSDEEKLYQNIYFSHSYLTSLNKNRLSLLIYYVYRTLIQPIYVIVSPVLCFIIPYIVLRFKMGLSLSVPVYLKILAKVLPASFGFVKNAKQSPKKLVWVYLSSIVSLLFYVQTVYTHIIQVYTLIDTSKTVKKRIINLHQTLIDTRKIHQLLKWKEPLPPIPWYLDDIGEYDTTPCFSWRYWLLKVDNFKFIPDWLVLLGKLDMVISIATIIRELNDYGLPVCYPDRFNHESVSHLTALELWNPGLLDSGKPIITNSIELGGNYKRNMLVSGPNAGGKSTLVKAICLNCLLAETFGFATSSYFKFTPYQLIYTHFRIHDQTGENSLFQEEVNRCQFLFSNLPKSNGHFLTIFDELFCSTSVLEGISCAYSLAELIGSYPNGTTLITTHYPLLEHLSETESSYLNSKMSCRIHQDKPQFSYKLLRGISDCHVALHLLNLNPVTEKLVRKSRLMLERLLADNDGKFIFFKKTISA